jgi:hypothetical protein
MRNFLTSFRITIKILVFLINQLICFSQSPSNLKEYLNILYQGFPVGENETLIKKYAELNLGFTPTINIYDSAYIDFRTNRFSDKAFKFKPLSTSFEHFYSYKWPTANGIITHSVSTLLTLFYGDSLSNECSDQYSIIFEQLNKLTSKCQSYDLLEDSLKIGIGCDFYTHKRDKFPIISIRLFSGSRTKSNSRIEINFLKILSK